MTMSTYLMSSQMPKHDTVVVVMYSTGGSVTTSDALHKYKALYGNMTVPWRYATPMEISFFEEERMRVAQNS